MLLNNHKRLFALALCALIVFLSVFLQPVHAQESPVKILSSNGFIDILDEYSIYGELQNVGSQPIKYVKINATFYDAQGSILGSGHTSAALSVLHPNERSPFQLWFADTVLSAKVDHYTFTTDYRIAQALPQKLRILSSTMKVENYGSLGYLTTVDGEIQNLGDTPSRYTEVIATFYDANGKVVDADFVYAESYPDAFSWEDTYGKLYTRASFHIGYTGLASSYRLTAQSLDYSLLDILPSPTPTATPSPTPTPTPTATPSPTPTPTPTATPTVAPTLAPTNAPTQAPIATTSPTQSASATPTQAPTATPYSTQNPTPTPTIPEFPSWIILPIFIASLLSIVFIKRRITKK